jgi:4-alpha-glucanotransferase
LAVDVFDDAGATATLRVWTEAHGEQLLAMERTERVVGQEAAGDVAGARAGEAALGASEYAHYLRFSTTYQVEEPGLVWYSFILEGSGGRVEFYGAQEGRVGGVGASYDHEPPSFQLTCYVPRAHKPRWWQEGRVYQIFPDRFKRDEQWRTRCGRAGLLHNAGPTRKYVEEWDTKPTYERDGEGRITAWDFYGGSLQGIRQELPRLAAEGYSVIYLNPIFEAASNHRYDTGDYLRIDPLLGDAEDFEMLCDDARELGMHVMLDGVFNHCGSDSRYFNQLGNYPAPGAWRAAREGAASEYAGWFELKEDGTYACWWGVEDLPDFDLNNAAYQEFITGPGGVIETWTKAGAAGWRLDVADELTDEFIVKIKDRLLATDHDAVLLGEVWEDASHKVAYGKMRSYFEGEELDGVMNYPLRDAILGFMLGDVRAEAAAEDLMALYENYPHDALYESLNLLGSHDRMRVFTLLGGAPDPSVMSEEARASFELSDGARGLAKGRLWCASLLQMLAPGVPSVYYGDDAGVEGYADPYNRATYPWGHEDVDVRTMVRNVLDLRRSSNVFVDGDFEPVSFGKDVLGFWRRLDDVAMLVLVNASLADAHTVHVDVEAAFDATATGRVAREHGGALLVSDVVSGTTYELKDGGVDVHLYQLGSCVLFVRPQAHELGATFEPAFGVMAHVTSLPGARTAQAREPVVEGSPVAAAAVVEEANAFLAAVAAEDALAAGNAAGTGAAEKAGEAESAPGARFGDIPGAVGPESSAFIGSVKELDANASPVGNLGEPCLAFIDWLHEAGATWWQTLPLNPPDAFGSPYAGNSAFAGSFDLLGLSAREVAAQHAKFAFTHPQPAEFTEFVDRESEWLMPYAAFCACKDYFGHDVPWWKWPRDFARYSHALTVRRETVDGVTYYCWQQWQFDRAWRAVRAYAARKGVRILGDMPMYVHADSADVWAHQDLFNIDALGHVTGIAGCPPDALAPQGQVWGNPTYRWDVMALDGYHWWSARLARALDLYDAVRLDHFLGFCRYFEIDGDTRDASQGVWRLGPGRALFEELAGRFGPLPIVAEDLGTITPAIRALVADCGFYSMDVLEFHNGALGEGFTSSPTKVVYTSTHDTTPLAGFALERLAAERGLDAPGGVVGAQVQGTAEKAEEVAALEPAARDAAWRWLEGAFASDATLVMAPLQDCLGLGAAARMNTPGTCTNNWRWQAAALDPAAASRLRELVSRSRREGNQQ